MTSLTITDAQSSSGSAERREVRPVLVWVLKAVVVWGTFQGLLTDQYPVLPKASDKLDEMVVMLLFAIAMVAWFVRGRVRKIGFAPWFLAFAVLACLSTLWNRSPVSYCFYSLLAMAQYTAAYWLVRAANIRGTTAENLYRFLLRLALATAPIAVVQFVLVGRFSDGSNPNWDRIVGPFFTGTANVFAFFCGFFILTLLAQVMEPEGRVVERPGLLIAILAVPFFLCSGKAAYYVLPIAIVVALGKRSFSPRIAVRVGALLAVMMGAYWAITVEGYGVGFGTQTDLQARIAENMTVKSENMGRLVYLVVGERLMDSRPLGHVFGLGPGTFSSYPAREFGSLYLSGGLDPGHTKLISSQIVAVRTEYGDLGLLLVMLAVWSTYTALRREEKAPGAPRWPLIAQRGCAAYFILAGISEMAWESQVTALYYWLLAGLLFGIALGVEASTDRSARGAAT